MACNIRRLFRLCDLPSSLLGMQQQVPFLVPAATLLINMRQQRFKNNFQRERTMNKSRRVPLRGGSWTRPTHFTYPLPPEAYDLVNEDVPPPPKTVTEYEEVPGAFALIERLLPNFKIPAIPVHATYPTPSGYMPPAAKTPDLPYYVGRTMHHNVPVYLEKHFHATRILTRITRVEGDIWKFKEDLLKYLEPVNKYPYPIEQHPCQVSEVNRIVRIKGNYVMETKRFLLECGF